MQRRVLNLIELIILALFLVMFSCSHETEQKGIITGSVSLVNDTGDSLLNPIDDSGVIVALYSTAYIDTTIARVNGQYPNIGVQIDNRSEFDHRLQTPIAVTTTSADGSFRFENVSLGIYNLTFIKPNWGVRYMYDVAVLDRKSNSLFVFHSIIPSSLSTHIGYPLFTDIKNEMLMYPTTVISSSMLQPFTFKSGHSYQIIQNAAFLYPVSIEAGAFIFINPGIRLDFHGSMTTPLDGQRWWMTSSAGVFGNTKHTPIVDERFQKILISTANGTQISHGRISYTQEGLSVSSDGIKIIDMIFSSGGAALYFNGTNLEFTENISRDFDSRAHVLMGSALISRNVFYKNHDNLLVYDQEFNINNNYIISNWVGIRPVYGNSDIHHNVFMGNIYGVSPLASNPVIRYNDFHGSSRFCIQTQANYIQSSFDFCIPVISHNNFLSTNNVAISVKPDAHDGYFLSDVVGVRSDIQAIGNYWKSNDIPSVIKDAADQASYVYFVIYEPRSYTRIASAGIQ